MTRTNSSPLRLGFAGTPSFAAEILQALVRCHTVAVVYCQPPRPTGRGRKLEPGPVERLAARLGIQTRSPTSLRGEAATLERDRLDALIVAAYGLILPRQVLATPTRGCINVHASLLPRWRGAAPIERALMAGDAETGISIMQMDAGLDTGPILHVARVPIRAGDTGDSLTARLATEGGMALLQCLARLDSIEPTPQTVEGVTYAPKLAAEESLIDWTASARSIALKIRALCSRQPAYSVVGDERIRWLFADNVPGDAAPAGTIIRRDRAGIVVASGEGAVRITRLALSRGSGKPMDVAAFVNGHPASLRVGQTIAAPP
jgi:methionyl-tRNA formyltransferase